MKTSQLFSLSLATGAGLCLGLFLSLSGWAQTSPEPVRPVVTLTAPDAQAGEAGDRGLFRLFRAGPTNLTLHVPWQLAGSADNAKDYQLLPSGVTIPAGIREVVIPVYPLEDNLVEGPETVVTQLAYPASGSPPPYVIGSPSNAVVTIQDNDLPPPTVVTIRATDLQASERGLLTVIDPGVFTIRRQGPTNLDLRVRYAIGGTAGNGPDYVAISNVVVIPAGHDSARVVIHPLPDVLAEGTETVVLRLLEPFCISLFPPPPECYQVGAAAEAVVFIADQPSPTNLPPVVRLTRPFDGQTFLTPPAIRLLAETRDRDGFVGHVKFFANDRLLGEETRNFLVPPPPGEAIIYDLVWTNPPLGRFVLTVRARDNAGAVAISPPVTIWIVETNRPPLTNLPPVVTIVARDPLASEGTNCCRWLNPTNANATHLCGPNPATFVVRRQGATNDALLVHYRIGGTASNGVDYVALPGRIEIPAGRRGAEIRLRPLDDNEPERLETVILGLRVPSEVTGSIPPYVIGNPGRAAAVIADDDSPRPRTGFLTDRCFHFMKVAAESAWWRIEYTEDFVGWHLLSIQPATDGALHFVDPDAEDAPQRFYRALPESSPTAEEP